MSGKVGVGESPWGSEVGVGELKRLESAKGTVGEGDGAFLASSAPSSCRSVAMAFSAPWSGFLVSKRAVPACLWGPVSSLISLMRLQSGLGCPWSLARSPFVKASFLPLK